MQLPDFRTDSWILRGLWTDAVRNMPYGNMYTFHLHFMGGMQNGSTDLGIYAGGQVIAVAFADGVSVDDNDQGSCTAVVHLLKGEEVSVKVYYGNRQIWGSVLTSFSGMLIHSD